MNSHPDSENGESLAHVLLPVAREEGALATARDLITRAHRPVITHPRANSNS